MNKPSMYILPISMIKSKLSMFMDVSNLPESFLVWLVCDTIERSFGIEISQWHNRKCGNYTYYKNSLDNIVGVNDIIYGCIADYFFGYYTPVMSCSKLADDLIKFHEIRGMQYAQ